MLGGAVVILVIASGLGPGSAGAAGHRKLVEGTLYDTTCVTVCEPECPPPPHCGPITADSRAGADIVCAQRVIACPLAKTAAASAYPVYADEGAVVNVRRRGSATVLAQPQVVEGHFKIRLGPGEYVLHPYLPEAQCWTGEAERVKVTARTQGPIPASLTVSDSCVAN